LFSNLHVHLPNDVDVVHKLTLATYKAKLPTEMKALEDACNLLEGLNPSESTDAETFDLLQAVHKRLWDLTGECSHLNKAIWFSEKCFYLKNDYSKGINLAYLYNVRVSISDGADAVTDFVLARRTRHRVVDICQALLSQTRTEALAIEFNRENKCWVLAALAEAWAGLGDEIKSKEYQNQVLALDPPPPQRMIESTQEQLKKLRGLLADSLLKCGLNPNQTVVSGSK
jgi:hypothetical protein